MIEKNISKNYSEISSVSKRLHFLVLNSMLNTIKYRRKLISSNKLQASSIFVLTSATEHFGSVIKACDDKHLVSAGLLARALLEVRADYYWITKDSVRERERSEKYSTLVSKYAHDLFEHFKKEKDDKKFYRIRGLSQWSTSKIEQRIQSLGDGYLFYYDFLSAFAHSSPASFMAHSLGAIDAFRFLILEQASEEMVELVKRMSNRRMIIKDRRLNLKLIEDRLIKLDDEIFS